MTGEAIHKPEIHNKFIIKNHSSTRFRVQEQEKVNRSFTKKVPEKEKEKEASLDATFFEYSRKFAEANLTPIPEKDTLEPKY